MQHFNDNENYIVFDIGWRGKCIVPMKHANAIDTVLSANNMFQTDYESGHGDLLSIAEDAIISPRFMTGRDLNRTLTKSAEVKAARAKAKAEAEAANNDSEPAMNAAE
jgi:hypothetical protein